MIKMKRRIYLAIAAVAMAAMALPVIGARVGAAGRALPSAAPLPASAAPVAPAAASPEPASAAAAMAGGNSSLGAQRAAKAGKEAAAPEGENARPLPDDIILKAFGIERASRGRNGLEMSKTVGEAVSSQLSRRAGRHGGAVTPEAGEPVNMCAGSAFSAAIITSEGGRDTQFDEVLTLGDWDGREDFVADHSGKVDDFSLKQIVNPGGTLEFTITREAISEHTMANGFNEDIFYYGDSFGNLYVASSTNLTQQTPTPTVFTLNLPTALNAFGLLASDDQVVITGIAVQPVADLGSFARVNGAFSSFNGLTGEILYVSFTDTESGFRLLANGTLIRSGVLAFPVADIVSAAAAPPGIVSPAAFPVQVGGAFGVAFSVFSNIAGVCTDDDGSIYFQQVDLIQRTGGNIVKIASRDTPGICGVQAGFQDRSLATNGFFTLTTLNPTLGAYGTASGNGPGPGVPANVQVNVATNYSGTANLFGNIMGLACGPCNTVYAAVARSLEPGDDQFTQATEGFFSTAGSALGATPTMVIRFADVVGAVAQCTLPQNPISGQPVSQGGLPIGDGFADPATTGIPLAVPPAPAGVATLTPGVNNFRVFVLGNGPDIRSTSAAAAIGATATNTLRIADGVGFQVDATIHSGITVDEASTVYVVSGGTPAGIGTNPSPVFGEVLVFPDACPADGRADFIDLRGANSLPNPPSDANVGDGLSTRADHIFWQAPIDIVTGNTPTGIAGLNRGFLLYTNRLRTHDRFNNAALNNPTVPGGTLPQLPNGGTQGDDVTNGPIIFELFDPCHQVAGGDDQVFPFTGDDDDGAGSPALAGPLSGGFEFLFANPLGDVFAGSGGLCVTTPGSPGQGVWNGFWLNSNGNITFGGGDTQNIASVPAFRSGRPKIAAAWADLNPGSRANGFLNTFPVQALGFAGVNDFRIRWINVPEFGFECCGSSNTFSIDLFDDGTGIDENANQPLNPANPIGNNAVPFDLLEGPTANRFNPVTIAGQPLQIVGCPPRLDGTGHFCLQFCRMDILGTSNNPVITGFSIGAQNPLNPPGLCSIDLGGAAKAADTDPFRPCLIGEGTEPEIFEFFNTGKGPTIGAGGEVTLATPAFDLRFEGNDPGIAAALTPRQQDQNRGMVCFFGTTCNLPPAPICLTVVPTAPVPVAPGQPPVGSAAAATPNGAGNKVATPTAGIINALCNVTLNMLGCGIIPNETTIICQGFADETGLPLQRPGKTVTNALVVTCDTNGDGVPDLAIPLTNVTPVSQNLIQGTLAVLTSQGLPGTAFPTACCGGFATLTNTVTFTAGNNNIFNILSTGGFTRTTTCPIDLGLRAPVVISASPSGPFDCSNCQDLLVTGSCFILPNGTTNVTSVFAVDIANSAKVIQATRFVVLSPTLIDALFCFGSANAGHTFLIFASGPNGTSRNLSAPSGTCPIGNEQGIQVTVKCNAATSTTANDPTLASCNVARDDSGRFVLTVVGTNLDPNGSMLVGGGAPKKLKFGAVGTGGTTTSVRAIGRFCGNLPGTITFTNSNGKSASLQCSQTCQ